VSHAVSAGSRKVTVASTSVILLHGLIASNAWNEWHHKHRTNNHSSSQVNKTESVGPDEPLTAPNKTAKRRILQTVVLQVIGFEFLTKPSKKMAVFWVAATCSLVGVYRRFRNAASTMRATSDVDG
jgi:hypothetical protein